MTLAPSTELTLSTVGPIGPSEWIALRQQAEVVASSGLCPKHLRNKVDDVLVVGMTARELGIGPMTALSKMIVIDGKSAMAAELMGALVLRAGHEYRVVEQTRDAAIIDARRSDWPRERGYDRFSFTRQDAIDAELMVSWYERKVGNEHGGNRIERFLVDEKGRPLGGYAQFPPWVLKQRENGQRPRRNDTWWKYTKSMLWARAVSLMCRSIFPDVLCGVSYVPEELGAIVDPDSGEIVVVSPTGEPVVPPLSDVLPLLDGDPAADAELSVKDGRRLLHTLVWRQYDRGKRDVEKLGDEIRAAARERWFDADLPDAPEVEGRPIVVQAGDVYAAFSGRRPEYAAAEHDDVIDVAATLTVVDDDDPERPFDPPAETDGRVPSDHHPVEACSGWAVTDSEGTRWEHEPPDVDVPDRSCPIHGHELVVWEDRPGDSAEFVVEGDTPEDDVVGRAHVDPRAGARR